MKDGVMLVNTSRGGLVDTKAVIEGLKKGKIGYFAIDVYEEEEGLFFEDHSEHILQDDVIARLMTFQNVLITSHQAFLTHEALTQIAETTQYNIDCWQKGIPSANELVPGRLQYYCSSDLRSLAMPLLSPASNKLSFSILETTTSAKLLAKSGRFVGL